MENKRMVQVKFDDSRKLTGPVSSDLAKKAYDLILQMIVQGELKPGHQLKQVHLARQLNISPTPVREAMKQLEQEGWVVTSFGKGKIVRKLTEEDIRDTYELREVLEGFIARKIAQTSNKKELEEIRDIADAADWKHKENNPDQRAPEIVHGSDFRFHQKLVEMAGNKQVISIFKYLGSIENLMWSVKGKASDLPRCRHMDVFRAISSGDPDWAEAVARRHIREGYQKILSHSLRMSPVSEDG